jgi:predicted ATPase
MLAAVHMTLAWAAHLGGQLEEAASHYNDAIGYAERAGCPDLIIPIMIQSGSAMHLSWVLLLLGRVNEAQSVAAAGLNRARDSDHRYSLGHALVSMAWFNRILRRPVQVREFAEAAIALSEEHGFPEWTSWGRFHRGWALAELQDLRAGVTEMEEAVIGFRELGGVPWQQSMALDLALGRVRLGNLGQALAIVETSLTHIERTGEKIDKAELLRGKAEVLLLRGESGSAERLLREAIDLSRVQKAQFWELRATTSLARLLASQGLRGEARTMLTEIYGCFAEGFDTAALMEAKALLDELSGKPSAIRRSNSSRKGPWVREEKLRNSCPFLAEALKHSMVRRKRR